MTGDGFERLMLLLDLDRDRAGAKYEDAHRRLMYYFRSHGCSMAEDLVDETVSRITKKIAEGTEIRNIDRYWFGVARNILSEHWVALGKQGLCLSDLPPHREPFIDPVTIEQDREDARLEDRKNECMRACFRSLPAEDRKLMTEYCGKGDREKIALLVGTTLRALRVKIHRSRVKLKRCLHDCLQDPRSHEI